MDDLQFIESDSGKDEEKLPSDARKRIPQRGWPNVFEVNRATRPVLWCARTGTVTESEQR